VGRRVCGWWAGLLVCGRTICSIVIVVVVIALVVIRVVVVLVVVVTLWVCVLWSLILWSVTSVSVPCLLWVRLCAIPSVCGLEVLGLDLWPYVLCWPRSLSCVPMYNLLVWVLVGSRWGSLWRGALVVFWARAKKCVQLVHYFL
jgi:hypothetical protein